MSTTARNVILAALATAGSQTVEVTAEMVERALIEHGHLPKPDAKPTDGEIEEVARWLADTGAHIRHQGDGWRRLLQSGVDVDMAATCALRRVGNNGTEEVITAQRLLNDWHRGQGAKAVSE